MSQHQRRLSSRELCQALGRFGFEVVATRGSHAKLRRATPDGLRQTLTVPTHRELAPGTLRAIFRQACRFVPEEDLRPLFFRDG
jgi:predicted RNA binding protein YcfA (HicA-like mRNA interferase family)